MLCAEGTFLAGFLATRFRVVLAGGLRPDFPLEVPVAELLRGMFFPLPAEVAFVPLRPVLADFAAAVCAGLG